MNIKQFAQERNMNAQTVSRYINRHPEMFEGKTRKEGRDVILSKEAAYILDGMYPRPVPDDVPEDKKIYVELIKMQRLVISLQDKINEQSAIISKAKAQEHLIEQKDGQISEQKEKISEQKAEIEQAREDMGALKTELEQMKEQVREAEELQSRINSASLWKRITRKW